MQTPARCQALDDKHRARPSPTLSSAGTVHLLNTPRDAPVWPSIFLFPA